MLVLFRLLAVPETVQMRALQARPANPVEPCGSCTILSHDPTVDADRNDTVGEIEAIGACSKRVAEVTKGYEEQSELMRHNARTVLASSVTELPTTGRFAVPTKLATISVDEIHKQVAVAEPGKVSSAEQANAKDGADRMDSARLVGESNATVSLVPSAENTALKGTGVIGNKRKLRMVTVVLKPE